MIATTIKYVAMGDQKLPHALTNRASMLQMTSITRWPGRYSVKHYITATILYPFGYLFFISAVDTG